jgi:ABC-type nitrate/sulfonate/bicarbonate transport system substrate-binding protein
MPKKTLKFFSRKSLLSLLGKSLAFIFILSGLFISKTSLAQDNAFGLGYIDPIGSIIIEAAIDEGYFSEEGLTVTAVPVPLGQYSDFGQKKYYYRRYS